MRVGTLGNSEPKDERRQKAGIDQHQELDEQGRSARDQPGRPTQSDRLTARFNSLRSTFCNIEYFSFW